MKASFSYLAELNDFLPHALMNTTFTLEFEPHQSLKHLIESTGGYPVRCVDPRHPIVQGIDWSTLPPLLGFNEVRPRQGSALLLEIGDQGMWHPLLSVRETGAGRVTCWMTGASPHWGINLMKWNEYRRFWKQVFAS